MNQKNQTFFKRIMSLILAFVLMLGLVPTFSIEAHAATTAPNQITLDNIDRVDGLSGVSYTSPILGGEAVNLHSIFVNSGGAAMDEAFCLNHGYSMSNRFTSPFELTGEATLGDAAKIALNWFHYNIDNGDPPRAMPILLTQIIVWLDVAGKFNGMQVYDYDTPSVDSAGNEHSYTINQSLIDMVANEYYVLYRDGMHSSEVSLEDAKMMTTSLFRTGNVVDGWIPMDSYTYYRYKYTGSESHVQDLLVAMKNDTPTGGASAWIKLQKVNSSGTGLSGATFTVYADSAGTRELGTMTSGADGWCYYEYEFGMLESTATIYVKETAAPAGYTMGSEGTTMRSVTLTSGANTTKDDAKAVTTTPIPNTTGPDPSPSPSPSTPVTPTPGTPTGVIKKVDSRTNSGVGPATFRIFGNAADGSFVDTERISDASGSVELQWTDPSNTETYIKPGNYTVTEVTPPPGYELTTEAQHLVLEYNEATGEVKNSGPIVFKNDKLHTIKVIKVDGSGKKLAGATFAIYKDGQLIDTQTTGADGTFTFAGTDGKGVQSGFYQFIETQAPDGYLLPTRRALSLHVDATNNDITTHELTFTNYSDFEIMIEKIAAGTNNHLSGATFEVAIDGQSIGEYTTDGNGTIILNHGGVEKAQAPHAVKTTKKSPGSVRARRIFLREWGYAPVLTA